VEETAIMKAEATLKYARISARKVKIVADLIRGKNVDEALIEATKGFEDNSFILYFSPLSKIQEVSEKIHQFNLNQKCDFWEKVTKVKCKDGWVKRG
jgi:ribosomal protein L22